jgi:hypothetical protein
MSGLEQSAPFARLSPSQRRRAPRWFTAAELRERASNWPSGGPYRVDSIGKFLVESWLAEQG